MFRQKYVTARYLVWIIAFTIIGCKPQPYHSKQFSKVLSEKAMVAVMTDILVAETYANQELQNDPSKQKEAMEDILYPKIFKKHKTDTADYYETLRYYESNPIEMEKLMTIVKERIDTLAARASF